MAIVRFTPRHTIQAKEILAQLTKQQLRDLANFFTGQFLEDIQKGLKGEIEYKDSAVFELVDKMYQEASAPPSGCYFCDPTIDGNEVPFDFPETTRLCLSCQLKVANLLKAFGIDPKCLFPYMAERKVQPVVYEPVEIPVRGKGEAIH